MIDMKQQEWNELEKALWEKSESTANIIRTHLFSIYMLREKVNRTENNELKDSYQNVIVLTRKEIEKLITQ